MTRIIILWFTILGLGLCQAQNMMNRPQKLALVRAHSILPESLGWMVKRHGKELFYGLDRGMRVPYNRISVKAIVQESEKATWMIDHQAPFSEIVMQFGFVSGLLAVYLDPSHTASPLTRKGFNYYLNRKLSRFLFVFDGYEKLRRDGIDAYLVSATRPVPDYRDILESKYGQVGGNHRYLFSERSPVFGVTSIYFSNLARVSAQVWFHSWSKANGDLTNTPYRELQRMEIARKDLRQTARGGQ